MRATIAPLPEGPPRDLGGKGLVPGSKSHTQRALILAGFLPGTRLLKGALRAGDTEVLAAALTALGARCQWGQRGLAVTGRHGLHPEGEVHLEETGTALRTLLVVVPMLEGRLTVNGSDRLRERPLGEALALLHEAGVVCSADRLPLAVDGRRARWPETLTVDARVTTQVASGAMLGAALRAYWCASRSTVRALAPSAVDYLALTAAQITAFGFAVAETASAEAVSYTIELGSESTLRDVWIPPDPSSLAFPLALAALHKQHAPVWASFDPCDPHPDRRIGEDLAKLHRARAGASVELADLATRPDTFPALAAVAATRAGETRFLGIPALRSKESDRIGAIARALAALGVDVRELADGLLVRGPLRPPAGDSPLPVPVARDHRIVMAVALLGTLVPQGIALDGVEAVAKSWPGYLDWLGRCARVQVSAGSEPGSRAAPAGVTAPSPSARRRRD